MFIKYTNSNGWLTYANRNDIETIKFHLGALAWIVTGNHSDAVTQDEARRVIDMLPHFLRFITAQGVETYANPKAIKAIYQIKGASGKEQWNLVWGNENMEFLFPHEAHLLLRELHTESDEDGSDE